MSLYANLFRCRSNEYRQQVENFLSTALAALFNQLAASNRPKLRHLLQNSLCVEANLKPIVAELFRCTHIHAETQVVIFAEPKHWFLDLVLYGDGREIIAIENKVRAPFFRKRRPGSNYDRKAKIYDQLGAYARWLKRYRPRSALIALRWLTDPPSKFLVDERKYPIRHRAICDWQSVYRAVTELSDSRISKDVRLLAEELKEFLEEIGMSPIEGHDLAKLSRWLNPLCEYQDSGVAEQLRKTLREVRPIAGRRISKYSYSPLPTEIPKSGALYDANAIGDWAYCFEKKKRWEDLDLLWYISWGVGLLKVHKTASFFVNFETDSSESKQGEPIPKLPFTDWSRWEAKGWARHSRIRKESGKQFLQIVKIKPVSDGIGPETTDWFKEGIGEAAEIAKASYKRLRR